MQTITARKLLEKLKKFEDTPDLPVVRRMKYEDFSLDERFGILHLWRGDHDDLSFSTGETKFTVQKIIDYIESHEGKLLMSFKGVEIPVNMEQLVWADNIGCVTECGIVDVVKDEKEGKICIIVAEDMSNV